MANGPHAAAMSPTKSALLALALLLGCSAERPVYLDQVYIDSVSLQDEGSMRMVVRFIKEDGQPAPPAAVGALTPVVQGRPIGRFSAMYPVRGHGIQLCLVVDPDLPGPLFEPMRAGYLHVVEALAGEDRVMLATGEDTGDLPLLGPEEARQALQELQPGRPLLHEGGAAARVRASGGPMGWLQAPMELLDRCITRLGSKGAGAPRRAVLLLEEGRMTGRSWTQVSRWAASEGVDLHLVAAPPEGRTPMPGKIERPLIVYTPDEASALPQAFARAREGIVDGHALVVHTELRGPAALDGLGVRARLPREGWEEFGLPALSSPPAYLSLGHPTSTEPGIYRVVVRANDARGMPIGLEAPDVELALDGMTLAQLPPPPRKDEPMVLALLRALPESEEEAAAQREAIKGVLSELGPQDEALVATAGVVPFVLRPPSSDIKALLAEVDGLGQERTMPARDVEADLTDVARLLARSAKGKRLAVLLLTGLRDLRNSRGSGQGTYRFQSMLQFLRRTEVSPLWIARVPRGDYDRIRAIVQRTTGGSLWTVTRWSDMPGLARAAVAAHGHPLVLSFASDVPADELRQRLTARIAHRGRLIESRVNALLSEPAAEPVAGRPGR